MSFCYFKKSRSGFFACIFGSWMNCCDLCGWVAFPSNPSAMASRPIGCASPASGRWPIHGCRQMSANLSTNVSTSMSCPIAQKTGTQRRASSAGAHADGAIALPSKKWGTGRMLAAFCQCLGVRLLCRLSHSLSETLLQLFGHRVVGIEPQSLVEVVKGLAIVAGAILLRTHHDEGGVVEATERGEVGAFAVRSWLHAVGWTSGRPVP